jgi:hypothetical protein
MHRIRNYAKLIGLFGSTLIILNWQVAALAQQVPAPYLGYLYNGPTDIDIIMTRVQVAVSAPSTYYETMTWNIGYNGGGYCGLQTGGVGNNFKFTLWDYSQTQPSTVVYSNPPADASHYDTSEGTGVTYGSIYLPWQVNQWYRIVGRAWNYQGQTYFGFWTYDETVQVWTHRVTFAYVLPDIMFHAESGGAIASFLEDFALNGQFVRRDNLNDGWGRSVSSGWVPFSTAVVTLATVTGTYANAWDAGVQNGAYYLQSGGNSTPTTTVNATLTLPFTEISPMLTTGRVESATASYNRTSNQINVSWVIDPTVSPQFFYQVNVYDNPQLTGSPIATVSDINPDVRSVVLTPPALGTSTYYAQVSISDIFDQTAAPVSAAVVNTGATAYVWPVNLSFLSAPLGAATPPQTVTLTNIGAANLVVSTATISGTNPGDFAKTADTCTGATLSPNGTCTVGVAFTASATRSRSGLLTFTDNSAGVSGSTQAVSLAAIGDDPVPFINDPLVPASVAPGEPGFVLTVNGTGFTSGATVDWNGVPLATTFVSAEELKATVPATNLASPGTGSITAVNPGSALTSNAASIQVVASRATVGFANATGSPIPAGTNPFRVAVGDFNGDRRPDLAVVNFGQTITVLLGNGDGSFTPVTSSPATGVWPYSVVVGDFNGDGKLDLAVANQDSENVTILLGNGDGTFTAPASSPDSIPSGVSGPVSLAVGDFNGDGILDLAVADYSSNNVSILLGNGDGSFTPMPQTPATGSGPYSVAVGDFNGDGILDLAVANNGSSNVSILLGNGDGTFTPTSTSPSTGSGPSAVAVGDFNGDGKLDLAVTGSTVSILLGNGDGTFAPVASSPAAGGSPYAVAVGDFNGDGKLDLAVVNYEYGVTILLGNGDGTFTPAASYQYAASGPIALALADFNDDGALDLATANYTTDNVSVLLQVVPAVAISSVSPGSVTLVPGGSSQAVTVNLTDTNYTGSVTLSTSTLPMGVTATITQPGTGTSGSISLQAASNATPVSDQTITITASGSGVSSVTSTFSLAVSAVPVAGVSSGALTFGAQLVNTTSSAQTVTLSNTGNASLTISTIAASSNFGQTNNCGTSVAASGSCTISVSFTPSTASSLTGTLTITDNSNGTSGSTQTVSLSGTGEDFTISPPSGSSTSASVAPGSTANYTLSVAGEGGLSQSMSFTCTGVPSESTCAVSPNPVTLGNSATNVTVSVTTTAPSLASPRFRPIPPKPRSLPVRSYLTMLALLWAALALAIRTRRQLGATHRLPALAAIAAGLLLTLTIMGCGGGGGGGGVPPTPGTPAGTYTLTVTGTVGSGSNALSHSTTLTLTVT